MDESNASSASTNDVTGAAMQHHDHNVDERVKGSESAHININRILLQLSEKALPIIALVLASVAIGVLILMPAYIDARVQAGVAKAEATAQTAKEHARVALDKVEQTQVQLGAKGVIQPSTH
jgi:hypothetical protein